MGSSSAALDGGKESDEQPKKPKEILLF